MRKDYLGLITLILCFASFAKEGSVYDFSWLDSDKEIYVLQNRKFRKAQKVFIGGTLGKQTNGAFIDSFAVDLYAGYFFKEDWGIELSLTQASGSENATHDGVNEQGSVAFYRKITSATSAMIVWSPFYSKINTFNKIFYYDWLIGAGLSSIETEDNRKKFTTVTDDTATIETNTAISWMTGLRFYISDSWSTRIDFKAFHLSADKVGKASGASTTKTEKKFSHYYNINFGLNYTF